MKYRNKWLCLLLALTLTGSMAGCGGQAEEIDSETETTASAEEKEDDASPEDYLKETEDPDDDNAINLEEIVIGTQAAETTSTTKETETSASGTDMTEAAKAGETTAAPKSTDAVQTNAQTAAQDVTTQAQQTQPATQATTAATTLAPTQAPTEPPTEAPTEPIDPEDVVMAVIDLNSMFVDGSGAAFNGNVLSITQVGTYIISGTLGEGMIEVNTTEKVKLKMNGVSVTNSVGPALQITNAKRLTMTLIEGTANYFTGGDEINGGAIFSNDTLEIKGAGALHVTGTVRHGIASDDDIVIKNGDIHIHAAKTGMMANDDITVSGGTLHVVGNTNGMKSKGTMHIAGGNLWITGGPKETKSGLYSETTFTVTGGNIYVIGCDASAPDAVTSTQRAIAVKFVPSLAGGSWSNISCGGAPLFDAYSDMAYNTIFVCTPNIADSMEFAVAANGVDYGVHTTAGTMTFVTVGS